MILDHVGVGVRSIENAAADWQRLFDYRPLTSIVANTRQRVRVMFLGKPGSLDVKLIEPADEASPLAAFIKRGGGLHHLCFRCANVDAELVRLDALGVRTLVKPQPGEAFCGAPIAFVYAPGGLNVELIDTALRAARLEDGLGSQLL
jgi:methylmalonyl-CoA/ethylmalonyl-CoA epimerase